MPAEMEFFVDPHRCIGCQACAHACAECETHKGHSMIHIEYIERSTSVQTVPMVCMHCHSPTCADVCPADAIKRSGDGRVMTARKPRCIGCSNCVLACPFGVPKMMTEFDLMMKCDMCFDRTSTGRKPWCATVCPSEALFFGTREEVELRRRRSRPVNEFRFGGQVVTTKVNMMVPLGRPATPVDVTVAMHEKPVSGLISLNVLTTEPVPVEEAS